MNNRQNNSTKASKKQNIYFNKIFHNSKKAKKSYICACPFTSLALMTQVCRKRKCMPSFKTQDIYPKIFDLL